MMITLTSQLARTLKQHSRGLYHHPHSGEIIGVFLVAVDPSGGRVQVTTLDRASSRWVPFARVAIEAPVNERERAEKFIAKQRRERAA